MKTENKITYRYDAESKSWIPVMKTEKTIMDTDECSTPHYPSSAPTYPLSPSWSWTLTDFYNGDMPEGGASYWDVEGQRWVVLDDEGKPTSYVSSED